MTVTSVVCAEGTPVNNFCSTIKRKVFTLMHRCTVTGLSVDYAYIKKFLSVW